MLDKIKAFATSILLSLVFIFIGFGVLEGLWLGVIATEFYFNEMEGLLRTQVITWPWVLFYLIYGCVTFVLAVVANRDKPWYYAGIDGALLGIASYGTYNLTAYSLLEGFSLNVMLVDWGWGAGLTAACAIFGWYGYQIPLTKEKVNS